MQQGKVVKKVIVYRKGERLKPLLGRVGVIHSMDQNNVQITIDERCYTIQRNAVELLSHD